MKHKSEDYKISAVKYYLKNKVSMDKGKIKAFYNPTETSETIDYTDPALGTVLFPAVVAFLCFVGKMFVIFYVDR